MTEVDKGDKQTKTKAAPPDAGLNLTSPELSKLPKTSNLNTTLFDMARGSLSERSSLTGESTSKDNIYHELNRIMKINNYAPANLGQKQNISDKDLPKKWNDVHAHQTFKLYDGSETGQCTNDANDAALRQKLKKEIEEETSTSPVRAGEGYYQVWARMHPELHPDKLTDDAHRIKHINGDRDVLRVGERLATATPEERQRELERRLQQKENCPVPQGGAPKAPGSDTPPATGTAGGDNQTPTPVPVPVPAGPDLQAIYRQLLDQHKQVEQGQKNNEQAQGIIGKTFDAAKNHIGSSAAGHAWYDPRSIWSNVFDSDLGSKAIDQRIHNEETQLDQLKQAADAKDINKFSTVYQQITGKQLDTSGNVAQVGSQSAATSYDLSQHAGVDAITDIGVALAVAASLRVGKAGSVTRDLLRGEGTGLVVGSATKAGLMQVDGHYANLPKDLASGGVMGLAVPVAELGSSQLSRAAGKKLGMTVTGDLFTAKLETQGAGIGTKLLSAALKSGTSGAIFGAIESPGRLAVNDVDSGKEVHLQDLAAASVKGGVFGFLGGTALGVTVDGVTNGFKSLKPRPISTAPIKINGVDVPGSGTVSLGDAAKIMKEDGADFSARAEKDPYSAVGKAVDLFEKHGLNIQKNDPLTGDSAIC